MPRYDAAVKAIRRLAIDLLAGTSALLCLATAAMWVRSYWVADVWIHQMPISVRDNLTSSHGSVGWTRNRLPPGVFGPRTYSRYLTVAPTQLNAEKQLAGFGWARHVDPVLQYWAVLVPHWFLFLLTAILPVLRWKAGPLQLYPPGFCRACGYDLRATPGRCPECGMLPSTP